MNFKNIKYNDWACATVDYPSTKILDLLFYKISLTRVLACFLETQNSENCDLLSITFLDKQSSFLISSLICKIDCESLNFYCRIIILNNTENETTILKLSTNEGASLSDQLLSFIVDKFLPEINSKESTLFFSVYIEKSREVVFREVTQIWKGKLEIGQGLNFLNAKRKAKIKILFVQIDSDEEEWKFVTEVDEERNSNKMKRSFESHTTCVDLNGSSCFLETEFKFKDQLQEREIEEISEEANDYLKRLKEILESVK